MNLLDFLFPKKCVGCGQTGGYFCATCILDIKQTDLVCPFCERLSLGGVVHPVCKRKYGLDGLWSLGVYQPPLRGAIQKLKYKWIKGLAEVLVDTTLEYWARHEPYLLSQIKKDQGQNWVVVPVPLHWLRQNKRGFNQAELLGQILSKKLGLDYAEWIKRHCITRSQIKLTSDQRRANVKGAFALATMNHELPTKNIILIDDVWTTGSTLKECCFVLKRGGAKKVWALTLAR